jgi:hypothetical protein
LEELAVHRDMTEAISSLEGATYGFWLNITD